MERDHATKGNRGEYQKFFRGRRTTKDIIAASKTPFIEWSPTAAQQQIGMFSLDEMDISNGCTESCEVDFI